MRVQIILAVKGVVDCDLIVVTIPVVARTLYSKLDSHRISTEHLSAFQRLRAPPFVTCVNCGFPLVVVTKQLKLRVCCTMQ